MMGLLCAIAMVGTIPMWHAREYISMPDSNFTGVYNGTTDTGREFTDLVYSFYGNESQSTD